MVLKPWTEEDAATSAALLIGLYGIETNLTIV